LLIANSGLSSDVLKTLENSTRPSGLISDVLSYQENPSAQQKIYEEISFKEQEMYLYKKEYISHLYNDTSIVNKTDSLIYYLNLFNGEEFSKELLFLYSELNDYDNFDRILNEYKGKWSKDLVFCL